MPIAMSRDEWARINLWADADRQDPEVVRRREYVKYLDATSQAMTKSWPNSLENVNKRNEEMRQARIAVAEQANNKFYKQYVRKKKERQQMLMYSARDTVFKNKDAPKLLLSAVIETVIQKERQEQVKFNKVLREQEAERKKKDDEVIIQKAKEWNELMKLRKKRRFEVNKQHQKEIVDQAREVAERNRTEYETELNMQKIDNITAKEQIEAIKKFDEEFKADEKARIWRDMQQARVEAQARRAERAAQAHLDDKLMHVLHASAARIEAKRNQTERDLKNEKLRLLEKISMRLESGDAAREAHEQEMLNKAIHEKKDIEDARNEALRQKQASFKAARVEARKQALQAQAQKLHEFNTMRQWEIMNRFKNAEIHDEFKEKLRLEKERKINEFREDVLKQWRERTDREARELAESRHFYGALAEQKLRDADNKLLTHARVLLDEAKTKGRPDHALHKAIDRYCKLYRLYPMPGLPASLKEHTRRYAPRDGSRPDDGYVEPPPPQGSKESPQELPDTKRDGLQPEQPGPSKPIKKEETVEDYKKIGRANGLQRRNAQEISLPPISVIPCRTESCRCDLKPGT